MKFVKLVLRTICFHKLAVCSYIFGLIVVGTRRGVFMIFGILTQSIKNTPRRVPTYKRIILLGNQHFLLCANKFPDKPKNLTRTAMSSGFFHNVYKL